MKDKLLLGTRGSRLALTQTEEIRNILLDQFPELLIDIKVIKTEGDLDRSSPLSSFGGRGAFVRSIESSLLRGEIDAAVHSLKDLPSKLPEGLALGAVPLREDPRDVIVTRNGCDFNSLSSGSIIGTGSDRRKSQLKNIRPDLIYSTIRGNVETRLRKLDDGEFDAVALAAAGMKRLGLVSRISQFLEPYMVLPAPCQGAIGLECRHNDMETRGLLERINNSEVRTCVDAERVFIAVLGIGCHMPVGALAKIDGDNIIFRIYLMYGEKEDMIRRTINIPKKNFRDVVFDLALELRTRIEQT